MAVRQKTQSLHDKVVIALAKAHQGLINNGYRVSINPGGKKNCSVGKDNYPDVVIWKPNPLNRNSGKTEIIEEVETGESINDTEAKQWSTYSKLGPKFRLIVPIGCVNSARRILIKNRIKIDGLYSYHFNLVKGRMQFNKC